MVPGQYERNVTTGGYGLALWATVLKSEGRFIDRCGLMPQLVDGKAEVEIAYMIARPYRDQRLATKAAQGIKAWGCQHCRFPPPTSAIVPGNTASIRVTQKNGMHCEKNVSLEGRLHQLYFVVRQAP